ncbi:MAG: DUF120 domain-containing protein [Planctomycetes bacterium]|nr:DUF120 domain-containing protein [Planctomycetota bacterium]
MRTVKGRVTSGEGNFSFWIRKLSEYYHAKTGMTFFPGTLNVHLDEDYELPPDPLRLNKEEYGGEVSVQIVPCRIFGRTAFILRPVPRPGVEPNPKSVLEVATDIGLRVAYGLKDGDLVEVEVP